jgi:hypothetical protein
MDTEESSTGEEVKSDFTIDKENQQLIADWGLSVFAQTARNPGYRRRTGSQ